MSFASVPNDSVFRQLVEESIQGILVHREMKPLFVNESWARMHGYSVDEVRCSESVLAMIHEGDRDRLLDYMQARFVGVDAPTHYEYRGVHKDGSTVWLENLVRVIDWDGEPAVLATIVDVTERKQTQRALKESKELFESGFEHGPLGLFFVDRDLKIIRANYSFSELIGFSVDELVGMSVSDLTIADSASDLQDSSDDTVPSTFEDFTIRKRYRRRNGTVLWARVSAHWIRDADGQPQYRMTLVDDITERVEARFALEASERRFRDLVEGSIQGILVHRDDRPLFVNEAWCQIMGYSQDDVLAADSTLQFIAESDRARLTGFRQQRVAEDCEHNRPPTRYEYQGLRKDGSTVWLENSVRVVAWGGGTAIQSTIIDCTERKLREKELETFNEELEARVSRRTSELLTINDQLQEEVAKRLLVAAKLEDSQALYESLVETIPLCVARKDRAGRFVFANRALRNIFGKPLEAIIGKDDFAFSPHELAVKYRDDDQRVIDTGAQLEFIETSEFDDETRHIHTLKTPICDAQGNITGTQLIFWDVTDQVVADQARQKAQEELELTNRDLRTLLYVISHDLKEPLRAIQSFSMLVKERASDQLDERTQDFLSRVVDSSNRMHQLLDDVLMLSRAQRTVDPSGCVELERLVSDVLAQFSGRIEETNAVVKVETPLPVIQGDLRWLAQALQNLIANALKFTTEGERPDITIQGFRDNDGAPAIAVLDRGIGVDEKHATRIFDLFQRAVGRSVEGTGAGLAIVRQVAERHGGQAYVTPREGGGSRFVMSFGDEYVGPKPAE